MGPELMELLAQFGPLGLWTFSLLWMNRQQYKDRQIRERIADKALQYHQEKIVASLMRQEHVLGVALDKINDGLQEVRKRGSSDRR